MRMTEKFCREQENLQIAKAAAEPLKNRQGIALAAAKAWDAAARIAHKHEAGQQPLDRLDAAIVREFAEEDAAGWVVEEEAATETAVPALH
ncbi:hypothetical protein C7451_101159 [Blastomonas natatoria]|uniref:Uncharacterized protein n=1 Tax=Blastomonas natatoria TaxID=34015 RepID=A0A2V3VBL4_9SPHN|nr:hypothetical protein [Blastomonas natatoria]PXW79097.1 hypothetical protein C7451_101159 [Blastomonas natatoria]